MKIQVRRGVFETNSSSVHCFEVAEKHIYDLWRQGKAFWDGQGLVKAEDIHYEERRKRAPDYIEKLETVQEFIPTVNDMESLMKLRYLTYDEYCCMFQPDEKGFNGGCQIFGVIEQEYTNLEGKKMVFYGWSGYPR